MYRKLIELAKEQEIKEFITDVMTMLKSTNSNLFEELEMQLYEDEYGKHFSEWLLEKANKEFENEDGSSGGHWTLAQTNEVARANNIQFSDKFNQYDFNYVMNMIYSDYYGVSNDNNIYLKLALKFLNDKDAKEGKAFRYYMEIPRE